MPLEDDFSDIVKKARHGQGLSVSDLSKQCGVPASRLAELERGAAPTRDEIEALARALGLRRDPLVHITLEGWTPSATPATLTGVRTIHGDIGGYAVKGYVLYDADTGRAALIDTGHDAGAVLRFLGDEGLRLTAVCLTHGHSDHAGQLDRILSRWPVPVFLGNDDVSLAPWLPSHDALAEPTDGRTIPVGRLTIECMVTPGHTPGGVCYRVHTAQHHICFVGDTLFAGSIGRANPFSLYPAHLESVRARVLALPGGAVLFPGHGPNTTVAEELEHNPFGTGA